MNTNSIKFYLRNLMILFGIYFLFAFLYHFTLWLNRAGYNEVENSLFSMQMFLDSGGLQYFVQFCFTVPIWLLIFRLCASFSLQKRLLIHLVTLPLFVYLSQITYYKICDAIGFFHLEGFGAIWDVYIPSLFYILQFGIFHFIEYYEELKAKIKLEAELRQLALQSELSLLKAQLNPHFLYNVFNTINASIPKEYENSRAMIAKLSDLFRYQLKATQNEFVTLKEELDFVFKYLDLEKERFEDRLIIETEIDPSLFLEKIPSMILQPIVENAIKHGISKSIQGGKITVKIEKINSKLTFTIADTGVGIIDKSLIFEKGLGLKNTKLRLEKIYQSKMEVADNYPRGLIVKFAI